MLELILGIAVPVVLAVGGAVARWMFCVHSKLATIAQALLDQTDWLHSISTDTKHHGSELNRHDERIKVLEKLMEPN